MSTILKKIFFPQLKEKKKSIAIPLCVLATGNHCLPGCPSVFSSSTPHSILICPFSSSPDNLPHHRLDFTLPPQQSAPPPLTDPSSERFVTFLLLLKTSSPAALSSGAGFAPVVLRGAQRWRGHPPCCSLPLPDLSPSLLPKNIHL